jgi:hypothetical protein
MAGEHLRRPLREDTMRLSRRVSASAKAKASGCETSFPDCYKIILQATLERNAAKAVPASKARPDNPAASETERRANEARVLLRRHTSCHDLSDLLRAGGCVPKGSGFIGAVGLISFKISATELVPK